jgi:hypothetical protein
MGLFGDPGPHGSRITGFLLGGLFLLGAIYGFWLLRRTPKEECEATITQAPAPVQIRYFQRGFWIAAAITPALSAWLGYELYCVDTGKIPGPWLPNRFPLFMSTWASGLPFLFSRSWGRRPAWPASYESGSSVLTLRALTHPKTERYVIAL